MAELIAKIVLGGSLIGIGTILFRKAPILAEISEAEIEEIDWKLPILKFLAWIRNSKFFSSNLVLQKILSKIRVLTLVIGRKTESKLQKLREEAKRKKDREGDNYWEELKKAKNQDNDLGGKTE